MKKISTIVVGAIRFLLLVVSLPILVPTLFIVSTVFATFLGSEEFLYPTDE